MTRSRAPVETWQLSWENETLRKSCHTRCWKGRARSRRSDWPGPPWAMEPETWSRTGTGRRSSKSQHHAETAWRNLGRGLSKVQVP